MLSCHDAHIPLEPETQINPSLLKLLWDVVFYQSNIKATNTNPMAQHAEKPFKSGRKIKLLINLTKTALPED